MGGPGSHGAEAALRNEGAHAGESGGCVSPELHWPNGGLGTVHATVVETCSSHCQGRAANIPAKKRK